jgi:hypothetical protein
MERKYLNEKYKFSEEPFVIETSSRLDLSSLNDLKNHGNILVSFHDLFSYSRHCLLEDVCNRLNAKYDLQEKITVDTLSFHVQECELRNVAFANVDPTSCFSGSNLGVSVYVPVNKLLSDMNIGASMGDIDGKRYIKLIAPNHLRLVNKDRAQTIITSCTDTYDLLEGFPKQLVSSLPQHMRSYYTSETGDSVHASEHFVMDSRGNSTKRSVLDITHAPTVHGWTDNNSSMGADEFIDGALVYHKINGETRHVDMHHSGLWFQVGRLSANKTNLTFILKLVINPQIPKDAKTRNTFSLE